MFIWSQIEGDLKRGLGCMKMSLMDKIKHVCELNTITLKSFSVILFDLVKKVQLLSKQSWDAFPVL